MTSSTVQTLTGNTPKSSANDAWFTTLCTHKDDADRINSSRLAQVTQRLQDSPPPSRHCVVTLFFAAQL